LRSELLEERGAPHFGPLIESSGSIDSEACECLTLCGIASIFPAEPWESGATADDFPPCVTFFRGSLLFVCTRTAFEEPEMGKM
jgi:hypothetical protein